MTHGPGLWLSRNQLTLLAADLGDVRTLEEFIDRTADWARDEVAVGDPWAVWMDAYPPQAGDGEDSEPEVLHWRAGAPLESRSDWKGAIDCLREQRPTGVVVESPTTFGMTGHAPSQVALVSVGWPSGDGWPRLAVRLILPLALRNETGTLLVSLVSQALRRVSRHLRHRAMNMIITDRYSRDAFEDQIRLVAKSARDALLLDPELFTRGLETLTLHLDSYLRETFGDAADEVFLERLRRSREIIECCTDPGEVRNEYPLVARTLRVWADLLHLRGLMIVPRGGDGTSRPEWMNIIPGPFGRLLPKSALPWRDLFGELLLVHWIGNFEAAALALGHPWFSGRLKRLGWWKDRDLKPEKPEDFANLVVRLLARATFPHNPPPELPFGAPEDASEDPQDEVLKFWRDAMPGPGTHDELRFLLGRWMMVQQLVELQLVDVNHRALERMGNEATVLRRALDLLWERSEAFFLRWMLFHRQWSTPGGVDRKHRDDARKQAGAWLDGEPGPPEPPEDGSPGLVLHVDSLWTNLYLLHRIFRHFRPDDGPERRWRQLAAAFPAEAALRTFLRHLCRVTVFVLWQILRQERNPERFCLVPPSVDHEPPREEKTPARPSPGDARGAAGDGAGEDRRTEAASFEENGRRENPPWELSPFHQPVGAERYARSLVHLMDVFGHEVLHVEREVDIAGYMERIIESELLLHAVSDYYRDHLFHLVDLCLLGDFLLTSRSSTRRGHLFRILMPPPEGNSASGARFHIDEVRRQWFVAAVFHDVGYLFSLLARLPAMMLEHEPPKHHRQLIGSLERVLRGEVRELERKISDLTGHLSTETVGLDRGVQSAVILWDHLVRAARNGNDDGQLVRRYLPSLRAICQHSLASEPIRQDTNPLSYLMVLCDELQDWGRNRVRARELRRYTVFRRADDANWQERRVPILTELFFPIQALEGDDFVLTVDHSGTTRGAQPSSRSSRIVFRIVQVYGQDEVGYLNPIYLWLLRAQNLQRLVPSSRVGRRLEVEVVTVTGVPQRLRRVDATYSRIFQDLSVRFPRLRLGDLLDHFQKMFRQTMELHDRLHGGRTRARPGATIEEECPTMRPDLQFAHRIEGEMNRQYRTVEMQVFRLNDLCHVVPLPAFSRDEDLKEVARRYQQLLHELEDQRRLRGLHALRSGRIRELARALMK